ncbi:MAG: hypothetical protein J6V91_02830, partial [Kiritimatiellae bacterium]|nr:hypothetical protein [Kiritimatiellia bacterium]
MRSLLSFIFFCASERDEIKDLFNDGEIIPLGVSDGPIDLDLPEELGERHGSPARQGAHECVFLEYDCDDLGIEVVFRNIVGDVDLNHEE